MYLICFVTLFSGVAVFMFGMYLMKYALKESFGDKLRSFLLRFAKNRIGATLTGVGVTVALQSSSASSVLTAALADEGIISLYTAFWIIVGANVGTAFTGLLTAVNFGELFCVAVVFGVVILTFCEKKKILSVGILLTGFGLLFVGMKLMSEGAYTVGEIPEVTSILSICDAPLSGVLTGCFVTAVIQSSSAATALLQTLAFDGIIGIEHAYYLLLGSNIGTCATCAIATLGLSGSAKKVSLMHIFYNLFGSVVFVLIAQICPITDFTRFLSQTSVKTQIAEINILFNLLSAVFTLILPINERIFYNSHIKKLFTYAKKRDKMAI